MASLRFLRDLCPQLDSSTVADLGETKLVISSLIKLTQDWGTSEESTADVRKEANAAIEALSAIHPTQVIHHYQ